MQAKEIRQKFLDFMEKRGHKIVPSASLLPENDPTTLFTGSGMQPMVPYLLGEKYPGGIKRIVNSQKCFRAGDIEEVGDNRHTTFFEMLGNWSLGDYFKKEQIKWVFEFLTQELELDPSRLYVSVYRGNEKLGLPKEKEAVKIWQEQFKKVGIEAKAVNDAEKKGMREGRIFYYSDKENWWSRAGEPDKMPVGEIGGPDSEIFWDFGADLKLHENSPWADRPCHPACDCGRFMEIGNSVFMQYQKTKDGFQELKQKNIDFGGGLERLTASVVDNPDIFSIDLFSPAKEKLEEISEKKYEEDKEVQKSFRVILDHLRAATFLINDGAEPSNKDQGYFTRRLIRRAIRFGHQVGIEKNFTQEITQAIVETYQDYYTDLKNNAEKIYQVIDKEESKFRKTLKSGLKKLSKMITVSDRGASADSVLTEKMITVSDEGIGVDDVQVEKKDTLSGKERGVDELLFDKKNSEKISNKLNKSISGKQCFDLYQTYGFPIELIFEEFEKAGLNFDKEKLQEEFEKELQKHKELSRTASAGKFKGGLADNDQKTTQLHTVTHLMLAGLRKILGDQVIQKGSNITPERIRFDFSFDRAMTDKEKEAVEKFVNEALQSGGKVTLTEMPKEQARQEGVTGAFWEKYPEQVKVYTITAPDGTIYSRELCGGPHIKDLSEIKGKFKILKEKSSGAGVRRIKAVVE